MSNEIYSTGSLVIANDEEYTIEGYSKGWYATEEGKKIRHGWITEVISEPNSEELEDEELEESTMAEQLRKRRANYFVTTSHSGRKSLNNGDDVANMLAGLSTEEVVEYAEAILGLKSGELMQKYGHLNPGQIRMNAGNRIRFALRRGDITEEEITNVIMG